MKRWKALAGAALAAALVLAPIASVGAYAGEGDESVPDKVFICKYVGKPGVDERLQDGDNPTNPSINSIKGEFEEGHVIQVGDTFGDDHGRSVIIAFDTGQDPEPTKADCAPADGPDEVIPSIPVIHDPCGTDEDEYGLPADTDEVEYGFFGGAIGAHRLAGDAWGDLPDGWVDNEDGGTLTWVGNEGDFTDEPCVTVFPVPAVFNADPEPATCDAAGSFSTAFLGDREPIDGGEGWAVYDYENVYIEVNRTVDGEVTLYIWPKEGYVITGTEGWTQDEDEGGVYYYRTILIPEQLSDPELCPLAPIETTLALPTMDDPCGTENDWVYLPESTDGVVYSWVDEEDPENFDVLATVQPGFVVNNLPAGWFENEDGTFTFVWISEFTDVPCPTPPPTPAAAPPALAATGGPNMMPWGIGAALMLIAGTALLTARRLARR